MMRILVTFVMVLAFCFGITAQGNAQKLEDFSGMAGCWEQKNDAKKLLISEMWMSAAGNSMLGMGRTVKNGKTTGWEYMRIEKREDGIYFVSRPKENVSDTAFKLIKATADEVVFENKDHDFPQRVLYKIKGTTMTGRIEGNNSGKFMFFDFPMKRVNCG